MLSHNACTYAAQHPLLGAAALAFLVGLFAGLAAIYVATLY